MEESGAKRSALAAQRDAQHDERVDDSSRAPKTRDSDGNGPDLRTEKSASDIDVQDASRCTYHDRELSVLKPKDAPTELQVDRNVVG